MLMLCVAAAALYGCAPSADRGPAELEVRLPSLPTYVRHGARKELE